MYKRQGRAHSQASLETIYCAELVAATYEAMGLLSTDRPENWYDPGRFWSGDGLELLHGAQLRREIRVIVPPLPGSENDTAEQGARRRRDAARAWWRENGVRVQNERLGERLRAVADPAWVMPEGSTPSMPSLPSMPSRPSLPSVPRPSRLPRMPRRREPTSEPESS